MFPGLLKNHFQVQKTAILALVFLWFFPLILFSGNDKETLTQNRSTKGEAFFEKLMYDSAVLYFAGLQPILKKENDWPAYCRISNKYSTSLWKQGKLTEAENTAWQTLEACNKQLGENHPETVRAYLNLGAISFLNGKAGSAAYFRKAVILSKRIHGEQNPLTAKSYEWLGTVHEAANDRPLANQYLKKSLQIWENTKGKNHPDLAIIYRYSGLYYKRFGLLDSALYCFNKSKALFDIKYGEYNYKSVKCLNNICDVFEVVQQYDTAKLLYANALDLLAHSEAPNRYAYMMTYFNIGELYQREGNYLKALQYYQKILPLYFSSVDADDIFSNPKKIGEYPHNLMKILLFYKARNLIELSRIDSANQVNYLEAAFDCYSAAADIIDNIKVQMGNYADLLSHENNNANLMVEMAENALKLYSLSGETLYFERALQYLEKNKQMVLFVSGSSEDIASKIPEELQQKKQKLQAAFNQLPNLSSIAFFSKLDEQRIDLKVKMDRLNAEIRQNHPYKRGAANEELNINLTQIRERIQDNQAIIQFSEFCDDFISKPERILCLVITQTENVFYTIDGKHAGDLISRYYHLLSNRNPDEQINQVGHQLYQLLLGGCEKMIENKDIVIIPSQHISLVAFDAMPIAVSKGGRAVYFIEEHTVWKNFSITSFLKNSDNENLSDVKVLAMAPGFSREKKMQIAMLINRDTSLINLAGAEKECEEISSMMKTKLVTGLEATEGSFKLLSPDYPIIHLSTHGVPEKSDAEMVRLVFSKQNDNIEDGFLTMHEIFNLGLNAEMVVISACKTGVGKLNKGEGSLNLGWAFSKAGARSVVMSLWDANDFASSRIMPAFYQLLADGATRPQAMHQAKLDFLASADDLTGNPYFWAGFVYYGNNSKIIAENSLPKAYLLGIVGGGGLFLLLVLSMMGKHFITTKKHADVSK